jgi:hypothetical protein
VPTAAQKGPAGEVTLLGSIGFDGKAVVVCMGRTCAHTGRPHCGTGYVPSRDSILGFPIGAGLEAPKDRKLLPVDAADPAFVLVAIARQLCLQRDLWKKGVVEYREAPGVPIRLIHCCARRKGGQSLNTKGPLGP